MLTNLTGKPYISLPNAFSSIWICTLSFFSLFLNLPWAPSSRNAHWRHSPECVWGLLHRLEVKRMRIILFGYERVISRELSSVEKFSHKLEAEKCRCPCRQEVDVSVWEFEAYPNEDRRVRRERERVTNKHPSDSSLQTLKRGGLVSPFRVWLSGEKVWFASGSVTTEVHVYSFFLFVVITIFRPGSILSGPVACPWATIFATLTL